MIEFPRTVLLAVGLMVSAGAAKADVTGEARVVDGDTLVISGERIRMHGIDAPESKQVCFTQTDKQYECGRLATETLRGLIQDMKVNCRGNRRDRYGRLIAKCFVRGNDLGEQMVQRGMALAYRKYSRDYVPAEEGARKLKEGLWGGKFKPPWEWRRA